MVSLSIYKQGEKLDALLQPRDLPSEIRGQHEVIELQQYPRVPQPPSSSLEVQNSDDAHVDGASTASENYVMSSTTLINLAWSPAGSEASTGRGPT